jgi:redox-sensitive bicupin YhaK (pirin superfamily)
METPLPRRGFLARIGAALSAAAAAPFVSFTQSTKDLLQPEPQPAMHPVLQTKPLGFQWDTADPFLFCVHHEDFFPKGNAQMGPDPEHFKGRHMGDDFIIKDGFRMYHGKTVPGFPGHPHRGFETITVVRKGLVDHADSLGAAGRYGNGDVQWMTAGGGVQHSEMFPLLYQDRDNTMELFQIWLNLPSRSKMVKPHFAMLWREVIPRPVFKDEAGRETRVEVIAGTLGDIKAPAPPPDSWAADPAHEVAVFNIKMQGGARWTLPAASKGINRTLYFYEGSSVKLSGQAVGKYQAATLLSDAEVLIEAPEGEEVSLLMLQGKPIGEPVMAYGPFVMNTKEEIQQAFEDYHATQFGGWPWPKFDQVHDRDKPRFARHADGRIETREA